MMAWKQPEPGGPPATVPAHFAITHMNKCHPPQVLVTALALLLLLLLPRDVRPESYEICVSSCPPGPISSLEALDQFDLRGRCSLTLWTDPPFSVADGAVGWYKCVHEFCGYYCEGYFVNPSHVFWDNGQQRFTDGPLVPTCSTTNVTSCEESDLDRACSPYAPRSCGRGKFVCRDRGGAEDWCRGSVVRAPESVMVTESSEDRCPGYVTALEQAKDAFPDGVCSVVAKDYHILCWDDFSICPIPAYPGRGCPPEAVSSWAELVLHCGSATARDGTYRCGRDCTGRIDPDVEIPPCRRTLQSCDSFDFYSVCTLRDYNLRPCDSSRNVSAVPYFYCWDKWDNRYCRGQIDPRSGTFDSPLCPTQPVRSCQDLTSYGIRRRFCECSKGSVGTFNCTRPGETTPWCTGTFTWHYLPPPFQIDFNVVNEEQSSNSKNITTVVGEGKANQDRAENEQSVSIEEPAGNELSQNTLEESAEEGKSDQPMPYGESSTSENSTEEDESEYMTSRDDTDSSRDNKDSLGEGYQEEEHGETPRSSGSQHPCNLVPLFSLCFLANSVATLLFLSK